MASSLKADKMSMDVPPEMKNNNTLYAVLGKLMLLC